MKTPKKRPELPVAITYNERDGYYHAQVPVRGKRLHRMSRDPEALKEKVWAILDALEAGAPVPEGRDHTIGTSMLSWLEGRRSEIAYSTYRNQRGWINNHIVPHIGALHRELADDQDIRTWLERLEQSGVRPTTRLRVFETIRAYYNWALKKGEVLGLNPVATVAAPTVEETDEEPFEHDEVTRLIEAATRRRGGARHVMRLIMGPRSGETLGLTWNRDGHDGDVDLARRRWRIRKQIQRQYYEHGCGDPRTCVETMNTRQEAGGKQPRCRVTECTGPWRHGCPDPRACARTTCEYRERLREWKTKAEPPKPCPPGCTSHARACPMRFRGKCTAHRRACPALCPRDCTGHAQHCPQRQGGVKRMRLKTRKSRRWWAMPDPLVELFEAHQEQQKEEAELAGNLWHNPDDLVFTSSLGGPIDPRQDWQDFQQLCDAAGVPRSRSHRARRTSASVMGELGMEDRLIMEIHGWTNIATLKRYVVVSENQRRRAADVVAGNYWTTEPKGAEEPHVPLPPEPEPPAPAAAVVDLTEWRRRRSRAS